MPRGVADWSQKKMLHARVLRKAMSESEQKLWKYLRNNQFDVTVRRQVPIGSFTVDFYIPSIKLAIEVDGDQHDPIADALRDEELLKAGVEVFRIRSNHLFDDQLRDEALNVLWFRIREMADE